MSSMASEFVRNYHWKSKGCTAWAEEWFKREIPLTAIDGPAGKVVVESVKSFDGDAELGSRKAKLLAIFDLKIELAWTGTTPDGTDVKGELLIPEVSHETALDQITDYQYNWTLDTPSSKEVDALFLYAKKQLPGILEQKFALFPKVLLETHGRDLTVPHPDSNEPSRTSTPGPAPTNYSPAPPTSVAAPSQPKPKPVALTNTSSVTVESSFMASADDLFDLFTNESRIPMWSRAPAQSKVEPGGSFSLFGGGVKGTFVSLNRPTQYVQNWVLDNPKWPDGHTAILTTSFEQSSDSTTVKLSLNGVPKGMEDEIERNLEGYYMRGLKSIGYVSVPSSYARRTTSSSPSNRKEPPPSNTAASTQWSALAVAALVLIGAFVFPLFTSAR
ncbi:activator of Hsp90 ATPase [Auriculariales sp. MPI-PUGE-AT-0066]|nr:activator of Hsp90 ATPase [Auriculariales sp. MPI-PUGE-AT-0066]